MTTVGSIGIGLFLLIIVWILALIAFVISVKLQSNFGWLVIGFTIVFTIVLITLPIDKRFKEEQEEIVLERDYTYIYKNILLTFLIVAAIIGSLVVFLSHCIEPIQPRAIKLFYTA